MITNTFAFNKSIFLNTLLPFVIDRFELWKTSFETFIEAYNFEMWNILNNGTFIPNFSFNDEVVNKPDFDWTKEKLRKVKLSFKVKHFLINALSFKKFYYVFTCKSAKKV